MTPRPDHGERTYRGTSSLTGRKAIITGADSGIGRVAIAYAREGADVVLSYLPSEEEDAREVVTLVREAGRTAVAVPGDVSDEDYCTALVERAVSEFGGLDILVNNAGRQQYVEDIAELSTAHFDNTFRTNVYATFWLCRAAVPHMRAGSAIINTASFEVYKPSPILLDYASTKAAINGFSRALAQQLAPKGIRVNVVAPGPIWTPLHVVGGPPLGRPGQPAELAPAFVFLASPESSYVVGETLAVTGGYPTP